jgi:hypothetical protein
VPLLPLELPLLVQGLPQLGLLPLGLELPQLVLVLRLLPPLGLFLQLRLLLLQSWTTAI